MAVAHPGLDHRHLAVADHRVDQAGAAAGDQHVHQAAGRHQLGGHLPGAGDQLDRIGRQVGVGQPLAERLDDRGVRVGRRGGSAQQCRVAGLQADAPGVGRHVRARLVDDADHAERHSHLTDLHPVGVRPATDHVADRIGQPGEVTQALHHAGDPVRGEPQAVDQRGAGAVVPGPGDVEGVGIEHRGLGLVQSVGHGLQPGVLDGPRRLGQDPGRLACPDGLFGDTHDVSPRLSGRTAQI